MIDIPSELSSYYSAKTQPEIVEIGEHNYLSILGSGSPGTNIFYQKKTAILEFVTQLQNRFKGTQKSFKNDIVEIFYWFDDKEGFIDIGDFYTTVDLDLLHYRIAVLIPNFVTDEDIKTIAVKNSDIHFATEFKRFTYTAGKSVQLMHLGPLAGELETLPVLQEFATENSLVKSGMHHEIHLIHFEKGQSQQHLKTILRDPVNSIQ
jgi:hypothetical protein